MTNQIKIKPEIGTRYLDTSTGQVLVVHTADDEKVTLRASSQSPFNVILISHVMSIDDFEQLVDDGLFVREAK